MTIKEIMKLLSPDSGWTFFYTLLVIIILYILKPESFEKLLSYLFKILSYISSKASKAYIKHDIQSRMNYFIKTMDKKIFSFSSVKINVDFLDPDEKSDDIKSYLYEGTYFIRTKKVNNPNNNFVNIAMAFISANLLKDAKIQISKKQKITIDLFVGKKLFESEKEEVMGEFVSDFLQPVNQDEKIKDLLKKFQSTDRAGLFFSILLEELTFLGKKFFTEPKNNRIEKEVSELINFLYNHSNRELGEDSTEKETKFKADFLKFALMIVGRKENIQSKKLDIYKKYILTLMDNKFENIYLIGDEKSKHFINKIYSNELLKDKGYFIYKQETYSSVLKKAGGFLKVRTYLSLIRKLNIDPIN